MDIIQEHTCPHCDQPIIADSKTMKMHEYCCGNMPKGLCMGCKHYDDHHLAPDDWGGPKCHHPTMSKGLPDYWINVITCDYYRKKEYGN